jgi:hypothetical protein
MYIYVYLNFQLSLSREISQFYEKCKHAYLESVV